MRRASRPRAILNIIACCASLLLGDAVLWPQPKEASNGTATIQLSRSFSIRDVSREDTSTVASAIARYEALIFPHQPSPRHLRADTLVGLNISAMDLSEAAPQLETDESYHLVVPLSGDATLIAPTIYGVLRGLETFSQLVSFNFAEGSYIIKDGPWEVRDAPRFPWRGLLIDTSRHFQPLPHIYDVLDSMAYAKLNVLHWHLVDTESFPVQSLEYPKLWDGAYSDEERYLQSDIKMVVEYARLRGIRVLPEFDMPGHAASWCRGYPEVCPSPTCMQPLNPANNATFDLIHGLLSEVTGGGARRTGLFPDDFLHLGGDEVDTSCWDLTPSVAAWLEERGFTADDAYKYFVDRAAQIAFSVNRQPVQWVEVFEHFKDKLDKRTVVHVWKEKSTMRAILAAGYRALLSNYDALYLDHIDVTWEKLYDNEPCEGVSDPVQRSLILGGQAQMWGETVDPSDLQNTIWPRAAAFAERFWSPTGTSSQEPEVLQRLEEFRCLLTRRGVQAAPVRNHMARTGPPHQDSCLVQ